MAGLFENGAFSRDRRLRKKEIRSTEQPKVRRDTITGRQENNITHNQLLCGNFDKFSIPSYRDRVFNQPDKLPGCISCPKLLNHADGAADQNHCENNDGRRGVFCVAGGRKNIRHQ